MLAEIHNKISSTGSNLSDRLEDKLTGDFFGALRYLPFEAGWRHLLSKVRFEEQAAVLVWFKFLDRIHGYDAQLQFWPQHHEGEIDLLLEHQDINIGIEVKYLSGLSSVDEDAAMLVTPELSKNQLANYSRMLNDISGAKEKFLIFLAPYNILDLVEPLMREQKVIVEGVTLGFLGWQDLLDDLKSLDMAQMPEWQQIILCDLRALLLKKRFRFNGFSSTIIHTQITNDGFLFAHSHLAGSIVNFQWPSDLIEKELDYVFENRS